MIGALEASLLLAAVAAAGGGPRDTMETRRDEVRIRYTDNRVNEFLATVLEIGPDRRATLWVGDNRDRPERGAGLYAEPLAEADVAPLRAAVSASEFAALPAPQGLPPGVPMRTLALERPDQPKVQKHGVRSREAPAFAAAETAALTLVKRLEARPAAVLVARIDALSVVAKAPLRLEAAVVVENRGTRPVRLLPLDGDGRVSKVELRTLREAPPAQQRPDDVRFLAVEPRVLELDPPADRAAPLALVPGGAARIRVTVPAGDLLPGRHGVQLHVATTLLDEAGRELGACEVWSPAAKLRL